MAGRVGPDGEPLDPGGIRIPHEDESRSSSVSATIGSFVVTSNGEDFLVVWSEYASPSTGTVRGARLTAAGIALDAAPIMIWHSTANLATSLSATWGGSHYLVAWVDAPLGTGVGTARASRLDPDGTILDTDIAIAAGARAVATASDGNNYLVIWEEMSPAFETDLLGARLDQSGTILDPGGFPVSTAGASQYAPEVTWGAGGFVAVWLDTRTVPGRMEGLPVLGSFRYLRRARRSVG